MTELAPLILSSKYFSARANSSEARQMAQNVNASGLFRKPVDGTALIDAIKWALSSRRRNGKTREVAFK